MRNSADDQEPTASYRSAADRIAQREQLLDQERARLEARLSLRRSGRSDEAAMPTGGSERALREIAETLVGLRDELKGEFSGRLAREIGALREEIRATAGAQPLPSSMHEVLLRLSESIEQLGHGSASGANAELFEELQGLRAAIEVFAGAAERNWSSMEQSLQDIDPQTFRGEVVGLAHRLEEIKEAIGALPASRPAEDAEEQLKAVASALERLAEQVNLDEAALDHRFAEMAERLDEISRAIVAVSSKADRSGDADTLARIEGRMDGLCRQMETFADGDGIADLADRVTALAAHLDTLASDEAVAGLSRRLDQLSSLLEQDRHQIGGSDLADRLIEISGKIDALDQGAVNAALAERLDDLAAQIDSIAGGMADRFDALAAGIKQPLPGVERLEEQLAEIARRLDETQSGPDDNALHGLETQLAQLSELIIRPGNGEGADPVLEPRLAAIEEHLATNDEYIIEAARQAAEAVVEAYAGSRTGASGTQASELAVITELAEDLRALEQVSQRGEERTARAFDAVHDTLVKIAEHLERLGQVRDVASDPASLDGPVIRQAGDARQQERNAVIPAHAEDEDFDADEGEDQTETETEAPKETRQPEPAEAMAADEPVAAAEAPSQPAGRGFLAKLGRRIRVTRSEPVMGDEEAAPQARAEVGEAPSIDPADSLEPISLNEPLEPGSGAPDITRIMQKVREVQNAGGEIGDDKADFIAAARRAAQAAAAEVETMERAKKHKGSGLAGLIRRSRRPILMAIGAVLLAVMSWPLVSAYMRAPEAPVASRNAIAQPAATGADATPTEKQKISHETTAATDKPDLPTVNVVNGARQPADRTTDAAPSTNAGKNAVSEPSEAAASEPTRDTAAEAPAAISAEKTSAENAKATEASPNSTASATPSPAVTQSATAKPAAANATASASAAPGALPAVPAAIGPQSLRVAAQKGEPNALFEIGARYTEGRGVDVDLTEAAKWYKAAAERGLAPAEYRLANFYEKGSGVARDASAAHDWYEKAAGQGNVSAMHNLAVLFAMGKDGKPDYATAAKWFRKAAEHGVKDSQFNLATLYAQG
ncbi:MAG TPA: peptidoglycan-binding protein, partial [Pararhizobium sp.]|nr:peptidoglycan-binding protein [Pararhizobium sp.]